MEKRSRLVVSRPENVWLLRSDRVTNILKVHPSVLPQRFAEQFDRNRTHMWVQVPARIVDGSRTPKTCPRALCTNFKVGTLAEILAPIFKNCNPGKTGSMLRLIISHLGDRSRIDNSTESHIMRPFSGVLATKEATILRS